ncbi:hypothetical protein E4V01_01445 [Methylorubrum sp. Q1]|nr:hypothetical protein E4V01_01445 [Methylorubrum sp. Q1]
MVLDVVAGAVRPVVHLGRGARDQSYLVLEQYLDPLTVDWIALDDRAVPAIRAGAVVRARRGRPVVHAQPDLGGVDRGQMHQGEGRALDRWQSCVGVGDRTLHLSLREQRPRLLGKLVARFVVVGRVRLDVGAPGPLRTLDFPEATLRGDRVDEVSNLMGLQDVVSAVSIPEVEAFEHRLDAGPALQEVRDVAVIDDLDDRGDRLPGGAEAVALHQEQVL